MATAVCPHCSRSGERARAQNFATIVGMNDDAFTCLYLHACALAELGRARFADLAAADDAGAVPVTPDRSSDPLPQDAGTRADDFDLYLGRIYRSRAQHAGRIAAVRARVALEQLEALAAQLPPLLPSLLAPLDR